MGGIIFDADRNTEFMKEKEKNEILKSKMNPDVQEGIRKRELVEVFIPDEEKQKILESYQYSIVQDFEDEYHMSDEERKIQKERYKKFYLLKDNFTKKIRSIDKYIAACRIVVQIINDTAEANKVLDPDEFRWKVLRREITINGLTIPKFIGRGRKTINWEFVMRAILDPSLDISELMKDTLTIDSEDYDQPQSLSDEDINYFAHKISEDTKPREIPVDINDEPNYANSMDKSKMKSLQKICPDISKVIKTINKRDDKSRESALIWQLNNDDIKWIEEYDRRNNHKTSSIPQFSGNISNKDEVEAYLFQVREYERETNIVEYNGAYVTEEDRDELIFKNILENNNYNLRNLYGNKEREKQKIKENKENKKKVKALKKMLEEAEKKSKKSDTVGLSGEIKSYTKEELEKGINKKKKKSSKSAKKKSKMMDDVMLEKTSSRDDGMKDYIKKMSTMSLR